MSDAPEEAVEVVLREGDLEITFFKSTGPGGQHKNKRETAVRIRHLPTGLTVVAADERSQARNREIAMERLAERLRSVRRKRKRRIPTKPSRAARERRLKDKRSQAERKSGRRAVTE